MRGGRDGSNEGLFLPTPLVQGYLAHKKTPPPYDPTVTLCLGHYGVPGGVGVFLWARYPCTQAFAPTTLPAMSQNFQRSWCVIYKTAHSLRDGVVDADVEERLVAVYDEVKSCRPVNFTDSVSRELPPRGSREPPRLAEGGALPYEGARHCPGFSKASRAASSNFALVQVLGFEVGF